jgi:hypothetical protein
MPTQPAIMRVALVTCKHPFFFCPVRVAYESKKSLERHEEILLKG